jgi:hypothetical protein
MTNQNPASSQPLDRDILAKLNAHADRSLDRLFIDIDELLSGDLEADQKSAQPNQSALSATSYRTETESDQQYNQAYIPQSDRFSPQLTVEIDPPQPSKSKSKPKKAARRIPFWLKAVLGVGVGSIAVGSSLVWLVTERKITIPQTIDTSWLPFQSKPQVSPEDAKFADYMRKSISKIESANLATATTAAIELPTPTNSATPSATPAPTAINPAIATAPIAAKPAVIEKPVSLVKTIQNSKSPTAIFQIDKKDQIIKIGQKIGTSNWSLVNISKSEVTIKRKGGEIRSIKIGQKF